MSVKTRLQKRAEKALKRRLDRKLQSLVGKVLIAVALFGYATIMGKEALKDK